MAACRKFIPFLVAKMSKLAEGNIKTMSRDSSVSIATCYGLGGTGIESRLGARFSAPFQTNRGAHPASYTMGTRSFPRVKRPGRRVDHLLPSSAEVKERVELYIYIFPLWVFVACSMLNFIFILYRRSADRFIWRPSPYRAVNTFHLGYKKPISLCCKWHKSLFVLR